MSIKSLSNLFSPKNIAILGSDFKVGTAGRVLLNNLIQDNYEGAIYPVFSEKPAVLGIPAFKNPEDLPDDIQLAVLAGEPEKYLQHLDACKKKKIKSILLFGYDFRHRIKEPDKLLAEIKKICNENNIRCLGPNSFGFIRPKHNLNVSTIKQGLQPGNLAFITQSATLGSAILDYALKKNIGFSLFISLGAQIDIDCSELIDFLATDPDTKGIVLHLESIKKGRQFIGAARSFAMVKPIIAVKGGKFTESSQVSLTHSGTMAGEDRVYDAVFKRAGIVRVDQVFELFNVSEALSWQKPPAGNKLLIVTNAGGPAVLATDKLISSGGALAKLTDDTLAKLNKVLPPFWSSANPIDVLSDASPQRIANVTEICLNAKETNGTLVILTPQFATQSILTAQEVVNLSKKYPQKTLLACWMGAGDMETARKILDEGKTPNYEAPEEAVKSFVFMHNYKKNISHLYETPANILADLIPDYDDVEKIINNAGLEGRIILSERESKEILSCYGIFSPELRLAKTPEQALAIAKEIGFPVAMKIESPQVTHKLSVKGIFLHVKEEEVIQTFNAISENLAKFAPDAQFSGVTVQKMILWTGYELTIGAKKDTTFGSVILFGAGGVLVEAIKDYAVALPPLNQTLVKRLFEETKVYNFLKYSARFTPNLDKLEEVILRFSQLICDFPIIKEVDINPFYLGEKDYLCLDARIILEDDVKHGYKKPLGAFCPANLVICPYPINYIDSAIDKDGKTFIVRPIKPEDEPLLYELFNTFSPETIRMRFFRPLTEISHEQMVKYCHLDYDREIALLGAYHEDNKEVVMGVGRLIIFPDNEYAEYAVVIGDPWQGKGIAGILTKKCLKIAMKKGLKHVDMDVLKENSPMRGLAVKFNFIEIKQDEDEGIIKYRLFLDNTDILNQNIKTNGKKPRKGISKK